LVENSFWMDDYSLKKKRIKAFLKGTDRYIEELDKTSLPAKFKKTLDLFLKDYKVLEDDGIKGPKDVGKWAEDMMTWGNILTHRSKFI
jgi:hypothetical protein